MSANTLRHPLALALAACLAMTLLSSCGTNARLKAAATTQGQIRAGIHLPDYPADCRKQEPQVPSGAGADAVSVIVGGRSALRRANARVTRCAAFYDDVKTSYGRTSP